MENSNVKENLEVLFEKFKNMIKVETVVGEAVQIGDTTLVPFVDVTFGFGTGTNHNTANKNHECGGGGGGSAEKTEEQKVMEKIGSQKNVHVTSDAELRAIAEAHLNEDLKIVWKLGNHAFVGGIYVNNLGDDLVITITAKYDYADTLLSDILTRLSNYIDTNVDASVNQSGTWSKVGVVVKRNETQSYVGIAIRVKNPHK